MKPLVRPQVPAPNRAAGFTRMVREIDPRVFDVLLALVLSGAAILTVITRPSGGSEFRADDIFATVLVLLQAVPLTVRRAAPLGTLVVINAALIAHSAAGYEVVQAGTFGSFIAVYGAASLTDNRRAALAAVISAAGIAAFFATNRGDWGILDVAAISGTWATAWFAGTFVRLRGEQVEVADARATQMESERDTLAREAVANERARMVRELHDIVGHALNVIVIQAAGARRVFDARPEVPRDALASIESTSREALFEMERMLGVLSAADAEDGVSGPQPGLGQLNGLAAHVSEAGVPVKVIVEGDVLEIPASVELSAYRIVQESLTNCLKHSGASHATVTVRYCPTVLEIEVVDDGTGLAKPNGASNRVGRGHLGMRERVALFGGEISIGPMPSVPGYCVRARLPFKSTPV